MLIKNVVLSLQKDSSQIIQHSTLSPIPGFRSWLLRSLKGHSEFGEIIDHTALSNTSFNSPDSLKKILLQQIDANDFNSNEKVLLHLCAKYLYQAKAPNGYALNPVANFHLRNGAQLYRINWGADMSVRGLQKSLGIMVNYKYNLENVPRNSARYANEKWVDVNEQVLALL